MKKYLRFLDALNEEATKVFDEVSNPESSLGHTGVSPRHLLKELGFLRASFRVFHSFVSVCIIGQADDVVSMPKNMCLPKYNILPTRQRFNGSRTKQIGFGDYAYAKADEKSDRTR